MQWPRLPIPKRNPPLITENTRNPSPSAQNHKPTPARASTSPSQITPKTKPVEPAAPPPSSGPTPAEHEDSEPYFNRPGVRELLHRYSENAAFHLQNRSWLRQYCALCSQWIASADKMKQHYRLSHASDHETYLIPASRLCSKFNTPGSPCEHCGACVKAPRQHPAKCTVLWQICLMHLKLASDRYGPTSGSVRPPTSRQPWRKGGGKGRNQDGPNLNCLIKALARLALQQETALKILRQDYRWVLFIQPGNQGPLPLLFSAAQKWKKSQEEGTTTAALRTVLFGCLLQMLHKGLKDIGEETSTQTSTQFESKAKEMKWLMDGHWCYQKWSPALGSLVVDETRPPLPHAKVVEALQLTRDAALHDPPISCHEAPGRHHDRHHDVPAGHLEPHQATPDGLGVHGGTTRPLSPTDHRPTAPPRHSQAITGCRPCPSSISRILLIRLLNSSNTCCINASVRAWLYTVSHLQVAEVHKYGTQAQAWRDIYHARRPVHVHAWANLHMQHDACEFLEHIFGVGKPQVLQGRWESRIVTEGPEIREQHFMNKAITLHIPEASEPIDIQHLIDHWHQGGTYLQACTALPRIAMLRISRFKESPTGTLQKLHTKIRLTHNLQIPQFKDPTNPNECDHIPYAIVACVLHRGATTSAGHYTTRFVNHLPTGLAPHAPPQWKADDGKPIEHIHIPLENDALLSQQCYILLLCRY